MGALHEEVVVLAIVRAWLGFRLLPFDMLVVIIGGTHCIHARHAGVVGGDRSADVDEVDFGIRRPYSVFSMRAEECVEL